MPLLRNYNLYLTLRDCWELCLVIYRSRNKQEKGVGPEETKHCFAWHLLAKGFCSVLNPRKTYFLKDEQKDCITLGVRNLLWLECEGGTFSEDREASTNKEDSLEFQCITP